MRAIISVFLFLFLLLSGAYADDLPQATPQEVGLSADKLNQIKSVVQAAVDKKQTAGAVVLVARRGKVVSLDAIGKMDLKADTVMRPDALFRIYSMTKPITSVAALLLVEEGKLKLDDPVSKYLPEFKGLRVFAGEGAEPAEAKPEMTVRDLMRHTSGLTYGSDGTPVDKLYNENNVEDGGAGLTEMVRKLGKIPLQSQPGTHFQYSLSTDVLGRVIEVASGQPLDKFMENRIFRPLDMHDTGFVVPDDKLDRFATSYQVREKGTLTAIDAPATSPLRKPSKFLSGGGGLVSTARDYARFCQMLLNGGELQGTRLLRPETVQAMTTNQLPPAAMPMTLGGFQVPNLGFGLGVSVQLDTKTPKPNPAAGEYGWSGAASTYFWVAPREKLIVIILQQVEPLDLSLLLALKPTIYATIEN